MSQDLMFKSPAPAGREARRLAGPGGAVAEADLLAAVAAAGVDLLAASDWQACACKVLDRLCQATDAARACIYQVSVLGTSARAELMHESSLGDTRADALQSFSFERIGLERWAGILGSGRSMHAALQGLPVREALGLQPHGITAVTAAPIMAADRWWGLLWLERWTDERPDSHGPTCSAAEAETLGAAAKLLGAAIDRCHLELGMRLREERLHRLAEAADVGLVIHDDGLIIDTNETFAHIFDSDREQLVGTRIEALMPPEHRQNVSRVLVAAEDRPHETLAIRRDGTPMICLLTSKPYHSAESSLKVAVLRDITRRKRTEQQLVIQKIRFEQLFENMPLAILMSDGDDRVLNANPAFEALFGFSREEVVGIKINDLIVPPGREPEASRISRATLEGETCFHETERRRKDGSLVPVEIYGVPVVLHDTAEAVFGIYVDRTEHRRAERALRDSEEKFRSLAEQSLQGIFVWSTGHVVFVNRRLAEITGNTMDEILAWTRTELERVIHPCDRAYVLGQLDELERGATSARPPYAEYRILTKHQEIKWVLQHARSIRFEGQPAVEGVLIDITKRKQAEEQLRHTALHDTLTGLANRALFYDRVEQALRGRRDNRAFAVLFLDVDRFKVVNDSLGHAVGDQLLVQIGRRLLNLIRPGDTVARLGGDEFTILVNDIRDTADAVRVAERIRSSLARPFIVGQHEVFSSASTGIALSATGYSTAQEMVRDADIAMYRAKAQGRARHEVFDPEMHTRAVALLRLETDLRRAVEREEFVLEYQPIIALGNARMIALEALLRWRHPQRGLLLPADFLPLAEETGLIMPIGEWVLRTACHEAATWQSLGPGEGAPSVAVNLFSRQLSRTDLVGLVDEALAASGLDGRRLQLELTESAMIEDPELAVRVFERLRRRGIMISLDDFGTGYSSLGYLQRLAVDTLKIDRTFIRRFGEEGSSSRIVEAIVGLAHSLGMEALAEGIETEGQLHRLVELGCDNGQGYLFSRSVGAADVRALVQDQRPLTAFTIQPARPAPGSTRSP